MEFLCFEHLDGLILALPFSNVCPYHTTTTVNGPWSRAQYQYIFFLTGKPAPIFFAASACSQMEIVLIRKKKVFQLPPRAQHICMNTLF